MIENRRIGKALRYCEIESCDLVLYSKGLCRGHYSRKMQSKDGTFSHDPIRATSKRSAGLFRESENLKMCSKCQEDKSPENFSRNARYKDGFSPQCRNCVGAISRWKFYGLTEQELTAMWEAQDRKCGICREDILLMGEHVDGKYIKPGNIDHDHSCCPGPSSCGACVRGLLCFSCNKGIGNFEDSIERLQNAQEYLRKSPADKLGSAKWN